MISGHAYARALRGHFLVCAALNALMLEENIDCLADINLSQFQNVYNSLFDVSSETISIVNESVVTNLSQTLDKISANLSSQSRTGKLWINYLRHINILRLFIYAERTGNWDLHLYSVVEMIPILQRQDIWHMPAQQEDTSIQ